MKTPKVHVVIGDTQVKPGVPTKHLSWIGQYIVDQFAGREGVEVVHLGDHADMPSLSSYDKGTQKLEGKRVVRDIEAANTGFDLLMEPLDTHNKKQRKARSGKVWNPSRTILEGNHEHRIVRAANADAQLEGLLSLDALNYKTWGWDFVPFLKPKIIDGVSYCHYFYNPNTGRPLAGENLETRLKNIGHSFTMGHQQGMKYAVRAVNGQLHQGLVNGSCLTPDHKVLTADLRYVPLGDIRAGDRLTAFDENRTGLGRGNSREYKTGTVIATKTRPAEVFEVLLSDGKRFRTTADHRWLVKCAGGKTSSTSGDAYRWCQTSNLRKGTRPVRLLEEWSDDNSREMGWLQGMYDGEGCYYHRRTTRGVSGQLSLTQKEGVVLEEARRILIERLGLETVTETTDSRSACTLRVRGGVRSIAKVLGIVRPHRLLPKFQPEHLGRIKNRSSDNPAVVSVTPVGVQDIVMIEIDTGTMIVEGFAHHNCYLHDEEYLGPQGNAYWRGIVVCHQVSRGSYDPMFVSLDYLCRRYEGKTLSAFLNRRAA
jgi:hypothetical protein